MYPLPILIDRDPQTPADLLAFFDDRRRFIERANLEHIRIIPAFFQCGMGENEFQFGFEAKQFFLIAHNQLVSIFIRLGNAAGIFELPLLLPDLSIEK